MIQKMIKSYGDFVARYGFFPLGFILAPDCYTSFRAELRALYPNGDITQMTAFMGLRVSLCNTACGISFEIDSTHLASFVAAPAPGKP